MVSCILSWLGWSCFLLCLVDTKHVCAAAVGVVAKVGHAGLVAAVVLPAQHLSLYVQIPPSCVPNPTSHYCCPGITQGMGR